MPYLDHERRHELLNLDYGTVDVAVTRHDLGGAMGKAMENGGDFQYMIAVAIQTYLEKTSLRYVHCEEIMGALTGATHEFYREIVGPYEASKGNQNGPVYDLENLGSDGY